jgi:hypothetical protein
MTPSPNGQHKAELAYAGEIRFGPAYHLLLLDGVAVRGRIFGSALQWSNDSRLLAVEEWLTTDYEQGPITRVALFDIERQVWTPLRSIVKGFPAGFRFKDATFIYRKRFFASGRIEEVAVDIPSMKNWEPVSLS